MKGRKAAELCLKALLLLVSACNRSEMSVRLLGKGREGVAKLSIAVSSNTQGMGG